MESNAAQITKSAEYSTNLGTLQTQFFNKETTNYLKKTTTIITAVIAVQPKISSFEKSVFAVNTKGTNGLVTVRFA